MTEQVERWLDVAENRGDWERLRRALALETGFALFVVDVPDPETEGRVVELLARVRDSWLCLDARASGSEAPVRELLGRRECSVVLRTVEASRRDIEALERCLIQLNARRDQLVERGHLLVIVLRRDAVSHMLDVAPDLYSVHRSRFRFAQLVPPRPVPLWLLTVPEFAALVDDDGRPLPERIARYNAMFWPDEYEQEPEWGRIAARSGDFAAARIFARYEGVNCPVGPAYDDLASLFDSTELGAVMRAWDYLQRSELGKASSALDAASRRRPNTFLWERRIEMLERHLAAAEGTLMVAEFSRSPDPDMPILLLPTLWNSLFLSLAAIEWDVRPSSTAVRRLRRVLGSLESRNRNRWLFDPHIGAVSRELIEAAQHGSDALSWLGEHRDHRDAYWDATWVVQLMLERARAQSDRVHELVNLGRDSIAAPTQRSVYEVWRPLVDVGVEWGRPAWLDQLARQPLGPDAATRFGPKLGAALHVTADVIDRGLVELSTSQRDDLLVRAAARTALPLPLRLGWWAIEVALTRTTSGLDPQTRRESSPTSAQR